MYFFFYIHFKFSNIFVVADFAVGETTVTSPFLSIQFGLRIYTQRVRLGSDLTVDASSDSRKEISRFILHIRVFEKK